MDHAEIEGEIARKENNKSCEINREGEERKRLIAARERDGRFAENGSLCNPEVKKGGGNKYAEAQKRHSARAMPFI